VADLTHGIPALTTIAGWNLHTIAGRTDRAPAQKTTAALLARFNRPDGGHAGKIIAERVGGAAAGWGA
jgi:hypothetical protein